MKLVSLAKKPATIWIGVCGYDSLAVFRCGETQWQYFQYDEMDINTIESSM